MVSNGKFCYFLIDQFMFSIHKSEPIMINYLEDKFSLEFLNFQVRFR